MTEKESAPKNEENKKEADKARAKAIDRVRHTQVILNRIRANKAKRLAKQPKPVVEGK
jgi:hypothetical protein